MYISIHVYQVEFLSKHQFQAVFVNITNLVSVSLSAVDLFNALCSCRFIGIILCFICIVFFAVFEENLNSSKK